MDPKELPGCPPGYSVPRSEDRKNLHFAPFVMDVPQSVYINANVSTGEKSTEFDNDYCEPGWMEYMEPGKQITCLKAFGFSDEANVHDMREKCTGQHGRLAILQTEDKINFVMKHSSYNSFFIGGSDLNAFAFHYKQHATYIWDDGTHMNMSRLGTKVRQSCVALRGNTIVDVFCYGQNGFEGFLCERPGNLRIAPAVVELFHDDHWGKTYGKIFSVKKAERPGMFCVRPAYIEGNSRKMTAIHFCDFLEDMGHAVFHEDGMCNILTNVVTTSSNLDVMNEVCQEMQNTNDAYFLNMNSYRTEVAVKKLLDITIAKYNTQDNRSIEAFLMMSTLISLGQEGLQKKTGSCDRCTHNERKDKEIQEMYYFNPSVSRYYGPHWKKLSEWYNAGLFDPYNVTKNKSYLNFENIPVTLWEFNLTGGRKDCESDWPKNSCNDGKYPMISVVAGSKGLQDKPYFFRAPIGCSFGPREALVSFTCKSGWPEYVRETGDVVCFRAVWQEDEAHESAAKSCRKQNAVLASIRSYEEENALQIQLTYRTQERNQGIYWYWTGARKNKTAENPDSFYWEADGEPVRYNRLWFENLGIRNRSNAIGDRCLTIRTDGYSWKIGRAPNKMWQNHGCYLEFESIVQAHIVGHICTLEAAYLEDV